MTRMTIIPSDRMIGVDGVFVKMDFPTNANVHAIQIYKNTAEIEYNDGTPNLPIKNAEQVAALSGQYLPLFNAERKRMEDAIPPTDFSKRDEAGSWVLDPVEIKAAMHYEIDRLRAAALKSGVEHEGLFYQADPVSYTNLIGVITALGAGQSLPDNFCWRTADNINVSMDAAQLTGLGMAMLSYINDCYAHSWAMKVNADAAVQSINLNAARADAAAIIDNLLTSITW
jgi:hypothetical protein